MIKVAVTGGIGSGKSIVCKVFQHLGIPVFNADEVAKQLIISQQNIKEGLKALFGASVYRSDGSIDRKMLADIIFNNQLALQKVNQLIHPVVYQAFQSWAKAQCSNYVIQEAAVIFENKHHDRFDVIVTVTAPLEVKIRRCIERDHSTRDDVLSRMKQQLPDEYKIEHSDFVITNDDQQLILPQIIAINKKLIKYGKIW